VRQNTGETGNPRAANLWEYWAATFTPDECEAVLEELEGLDLPPRTKNVAVATVGMCLAITAPEVVCRYSLTSPIERSFSAAAARTGFRKWLVRDPLAASDWLDEAIRAGMFTMKRLDGRYDRREECEKAAILALVADHVDAANGRLARLEVDQRSRVLMDAYKDASEQLRPLILSILEREFPGAAHSGK
jgi:hypothetical protein